MRSSAGRDAKRRGKRSREQEQGAEQPDPDEIDEVPVVADGLEHGGLTGIATLDRAGKTPEEGDHGHEPEKHVKAMKAAHDVEERAISVRVRPEGKGLPFIGLVCQESRAEDEARDDPVAGRLELPALLRPHAQLERRAGGQQGEGKDQRLDRVEVPSREETSLPEATAACCGRES